MRQPFKALGAEPLRRPLAVMQLTILNITRLGILPPHHLKALNIKPVFDLVHVSIRSYIVPVAAKSTMVLV